MSIMNWAYEYHYQAMKDGDENRILVSDIYSLSISEMQKNPDYVIADLQQRSALARQLNEPWWVLFYDHWRLQCLLFYKRDYNQALDLAVRSAVEARKPACATLPQRVCLHEDLIYAYLGIDPRGHAKLIEEALGYMEGEIAPEMDCRHCLQQLRTEFEFEMGRMEAAAEAAWRSMAMAEHEWSGDHYRSYAYMTLCRIAHERGEWDNLREWARAGEECARDADRQDGVAEFLMWQALTAAKAGEKQEAARFAALGEARARQVAAVRPGYYDALAAYHEALGEMDEALKVREQELTILQGSGQTFWECGTHLKRCQLLHAMGLATQEAVDQARQAINKLSDPTDLLKTLDEIAPAA